MEQTCIVHLIRNRLQLASPSARDAVKRDIKTIYTTLNPASHWTNSMSNTADTRRHDPAPTQRWDDYAPLLNYDIEIRRMICSTKAVKALNGRHRQTTRTQRHLPASRSR